MERKAGGIRLVEYNILRKHPEVYAFSTYRQGGVSTGAYASLNCTPYVGDDPLCVLQNKKILLNALPHCPREWVIPWQTHGIDILNIDEDWLTATPEKRHHLLQGIDAIITDKPGVCLCISTADCIPILIYDPAHQVIAAVHAGWRGTVNHLVLRTLRRMHELYGTEANNVLACIGPGISWEAFEVGDEVFDAFHKAGYPMHAIANYKPSRGKHYINLPEANAIQIKSFGTHYSFIEDCHLCTYTHHEDFFSARRLGTKSGRILSGIMLVDFSPM